MRRLQQFVCCWCCGYHGPANCFNWHVWLEFLLPFSELDHRLEQALRKRPALLSLESVRLQGRWLRGRVDLSQLRRLPGQHDQPEAVRLRPCAAKRPVAQVIPTYVCPSCPRIQNPFRERNYMFRELLWRRSLLPSRPLL